MGKEYIDKKSFLVAGLFEGKLYWLVLCKSGRTVETSRGIPDLC